MGGMNLSQVQEWDFHIQLPTGSFSAFIGRGRTGDIIEWWEVRSEGSARGEEKKVFETGQKEGAGDYPTFEGNLSGGTMHLKSQESAPAAGIGYSLRPVHG